MSRNLSFVVVVESARFRGISRFVSNQTTFVPMVRTAALSRNIPVVGVVFNGFVPGGLCLRTSKSMHAIHFLTAYGVLNLLPFDIYIFAGTWPRRPPTKPPSKPGDDSKLPSHYRASTRSQSLGHPSGVRHSCTSRNARPERRDTTCSLDLVVVESCLVCRVSRYDSQGSSLRILSWALRHDSKACLFRVGSKIGVTHSF